MVKLFLKAGQFLGPKVFLICGSNFTSSLICDLKLQPHLIKRKVDRVFPVRNWNMEWLVLLMYFVCLNKLLHCRLFRTIGKETIFFECCKIIIFSFQLIKYVLLAEKTTWICWKIRCYGWQYPGIQSSVPFEDIQKYNPSSDLMAIPLRTANIIQCTLLWADVCCKNVGMCNLICIEVMVLGRKWNAFANQNLFLAGKSWPQLMHWPNE